ncbi:MAG: glycosyltransferase family protein [Chlamydiota bacterium]
MKIILYDKISSLYDVQNYFTSCLYKALSKQGVHLELISQLSPQELPQFIEREKPLCLAGFAAVDLYKGALLCDILQLPQFFWLLDLPFHYTSRVASPYSIIGTIEDRPVWEYDHGEKTLFLPHAADVEQKAAVSSDRPYEVVFIGSCPDYKAIKQNWLYRYPRRVVEFMEGVAEDVLSNKNLVFNQHLLNKWQQEGLEKSQIAWDSVAAEVEGYLKGRARIALIDAIEDAEVHIWGHSPEFWGHYFGNKDNVIIHPEVGHHQALQIMQQAKVLLNSIPSFNSGSHERIFSGLASGCLVLADDKPFLRTIFNEREGVIFYQHSELSQVNDIINSYLDNELLRCSDVIAGQANVLENHTWDNRAEQLIEQLPKLVSLI